MESRPIVIIGGGVIGLSAAYNLARRGHRRVVLLEKDTVGAGASLRAAGITSGLMWSETGVKARRVSLELFRELSKTLTGYRYHDDYGCLNLYSPELWPDRQKLLPLYDRLGTRYEVLTAPEMHRRWPDLHPPVDSLGLLDPMGGYSEPSEYIKALSREVRALGVEIREHEQVTGFAREGARLTGVETVRQHFPADAVISTVHSWSLPLLELLDVQLPVKHFVHQRYLSTPGDRLNAFPPVNADPYHGYVRPAYGGRVLLGVETADREEWRGSSAGFHMDELRTAPGLRNRAIAEFMPFLPILRDVKWESEHVGLISFSMDGEPVLGPVAAVPGLYVGLAFHSGGFSYNPVAGMLLAEFVSGGKTSIDVSGFSPDRFLPASVTAHLQKTVQQKHAVKRRH